jgi:site-specific DNA-methyltransferase (adenine-specific)
MDPVPRAKSPHDRRVGPSCAYFASAGGQVFSDRETVLQMREVITEIIRGDCLDVLSEYPANKFDLIVTSPPYADSRVKTYGGIPPDDYVEWFMPRAAQFQRVLKPDGTFVLNIKEKVVEGERHTYVLKLILAMREQGWLWTEEFIWHKRNCYPGKWSNRFRDAWERCLQFNKERKFRMYQDAVMVPMGDWAKHRLKSRGKNDVVRFNSQVGSGFGKNIANWVGRRMAYPSNVLHLATETGNRGHSAAFPKGLPAWFIKLFTQEGDWVLDPFLGCGTSCEAARELGRNSVGIELMPEYYEMAKCKSPEVESRLFEETETYGKRKRSRGS